VSNTEPTIIGVILNWNGWKDTIGCLAALESCSYEGFSIVVVDNGSTDESVMRIREAYPNVRLIESGKNLGFSGGNNIGLRYALSVEADYVWLLNNDTEPFSDALSELVAKARTDEHLGAVSSICFYMEEPRQIQVWAGTRVNLWIGFTRNSTLQRSDDWFDALYGASLLLKVEALEDTGLLDEGFFLYWEETELCLRLRKRGWKLAAAPGSRVLHKVSASTNGDRRLLDRYFTASGLRILRLHSPVPFLSMVIFIAVRFVKRLARLQFSQARSVRMGIRDYCAQRPVIQKIR
jgi:GT2 family glycosyltransferase